MSLKDNFGGMYRKGGVLYYTICAHVPETQKCVTFVTFVTFWHKCQRVTALFVTLWHKCQRYCTVCTLWQIKHYCTVCTFWQICQREIIVNMQLLCIFTELIAFFSDFVHFTLKLFKILYYLCTAIQNHRKFIALSLRYHRTHVHEQPLCGVPVAPRRVPVACGCSRCASRVPDGCRKK